MLPVFIPRLLDDKSICFESRGKCCPFFPKNSSNKSIFCYFAEVIQKQKFPGFLRKIVGEKWAAFPHVFNTKLPSFDLSFRNLR